MVEVVVSPFSAASRLFSASSAAIELGYRLALLDVVAFLDVDRDDLATGLEVQVGRLGRFDRTTAGRGQLYYALGRLDLGLLGFSAGAVATAERDRQEHDQQQPSEQPGRRVDPGKVDRVAANPERGQVGRPEGETTPEGLQSRGNSWFGHRRQPCRPKLGFT